jgi:predicted RNA-binding protein with PIN domain
VVFDGQADVSSPRWPGPTRVIFSAGQDADRVIKDLVDEAGNPRETVVVTDDRDIQRWVRGVGARVMAVKTFLSAGAEPSPRSRGAVLHPADADTINEELKRLWKLK